MIGRVDLDSWTNLRPLSNSDLDHIKDHAIEVEEDIRSQANVETIVTVERWADNGPLADLPEALDKQNAPFVAPQSKRCVIANKPILRRRLIRLNLRCARSKWLTCRFSCRYGSWAISSSIRDAFSQEKHGLP